MGQDIGPFVCLTPTQKDRVGAPFVIHNNYVYAIGGSASEATVEYAPVNSDGTFGAWAYTSSLPAAALNAGSGAYKVSAFAADFPTTVSETVGTAPTQTNGAYNGQCVVPQQYTSYTNQLATDYLFVGDVVSLNKNCLLLHSDGTKELVPLPDPTNMPNSVDAGMGAPFGTKAIYCGGNNPNTGMAAFTGTWTFDWTAKSWTKVGDLPQALSQGLAITKGGIFYVFGGFDSTGTAVKTTYAFDGTTWTQKASSTDPHDSDGGIVELDDGRILVVGGLSTNGGEIYDPAADTWKPVAQDPVNGSANYPAGVSLSGSSATSYPAIVKLTSGSAAGKVLIHGSGDIAFFDPSIDQWEWKLRVDRLNNNGSQSWAAEIAPDNILIVSSGEYAVYDVQKNTVIFINNIVSNAMYGNWIGSGKLFGIDVYDTSSLYFGTFSILAPSSHLYVIGTTGTTDGVTNRMNLSAPINTDGSLGAWRDDLANWDSLSLPLLNDSGQAGSYADAFAYMVGGYDSQTSGDTSSAIWSGVNPDGTLGGWDYLYNYPSNIDFNCVFAAYGYLYSFGGSETSSIYRAQIYNLDGSIYSWFQIGTIPCPGVSFNLTKVGDTVYLYSWKDGDLNPANSIVYYIDIDPSTGDLIGTWQVASHSPVVLTYSGTGDPPAVIGTDKGLYVMGHGFGITGGTSDILFAPFVASVPPTMYKPYIQRPHQFSPRRFVAGDESQVSYPGRDPNRKSF